GQILDFGQPIRGPPPDQIAQGVAIELARNWGIEGGAEDRRRSGSGYRLSKEIVHSAGTDHLATIINAEKLIAGSPRSVDRGELAVCTAAIEKTVVVAAELIRANYLSGVIDSSGNGFRGVCYRIVQLGKFAVDLHKSVQ